MVCYSCLWQEFGDCGLFELRILKTYLSNIKNTITTFSEGFRLTLLHFFQAKVSRDPIGIKDDNYFEKKEGIVTLQYPFEELPVPDNGRYQLHNEIDDCIVCDKCAKVCPVNCIDIEPVRAVEEIGKTSDGTSKRIYAAKFDIDMAKCCFCGLCTTVCPTECLTMNKEFDFSVFDLKEHNFEFGEMTENEIAEKKEEFEQFNENKLREKEAKAKAATVASKPEEEAGKKKPAFKPKIKGAEQSAEPAKKPVFKPKVKGSTAETKDEPTATRPVFKPKVKPKTTEDSAESKPSKPVFRPKIKPKAVDSTDEAKGEDKTDKPKRPVFRPKVKPKGDAPMDTSSEENPPEDSASDKPKKPVFRPKIKPKK